MPYGTLGPNPGKHNYCWFFFRDIFDEIVLEKWFKSIRVFREKYGFYFDTCTAFLQFDPWALAYHSRGCIEKVRSKSVMIDLKRNITTKKFRTKIDFTGELIVWYMPLVYSGRTTVQNEKSGNRFMGTIVASKKNQWKNSQKNLLVTIE